MIIYMVLMAILNIIMLISVWITFRKFHILEIFAYWMCICAVIQQVFTMITLNLHFIEITEGVRVFWFLLMNRLILIPSLIIWLFYFSRDLNLLRKTFLIVIWLVPLSCIELLSNKFGVITFKKWNFACSLAEWLVVILISFGFMVWFRFQLKKEEVIV